MFALSLAGILCVNLIPLAGVLWFGWSVFEVLFLYWFENVAIGVAHAARLAICTRTNKVANGWGTTSFFAMHYGIFTLVHGVFVVTFFGVIAGGFLELKTGFLGPVLAIMGWQVAALLIDSARTGGFKGRSPDAMMFEPYPRVFALHIAVLAGGWFIGEMGSPIWALAVLVAVKTLFDLGVAALTLPKDATSPAVFGALRKPGD